MKNFLKKSFVAGLIVLLPIAGTLWLLKVIIFWAEDFFESFLPGRFHPEVLLGYNIPGIGFLIAILLVLLTGMLTRLYVVKKLISLGDKTFSRIPFGKTIYSAIKQFLATITGEGKKTFRKVVLTEFPSPGTYAIAFVTGDTRGAAADQSSEKMVNIFLPTTPNPTSGMLVMVPKDQVIPLSMSVEDGIKLIVSGGIVTPSFNKNKG